MTTRRRRRARQLRRRRFLALVVALVVIGSGTGLLANGLLGTRSAVASAETEVPSAAEAPPTGAPPTGAPPPAASAIPAPAVTAVAVSVPPPPDPTPQPVISPAAMPCDTATLVTVWAHADDDLIFGNPGISDAIGRGECVRSVYLTAGDAGRTTGYYRSRELGILRAYNEMRGKPGTFWDETRLTLLTGAQVTRFTPKDDARLSVIFLRLPDGGMTGGGFRATGYGTLPKLVDGAIPTLYPVDGATPLSRDALAATVAELTAASGPAQVFTHVPGGAAQAGGDHPDHIATGTLVREAALGGAFPREIARYYVGYQSEGWQANLGGDQLQRKVTTYRIYAAEDSELACSDNATCLNRPRFGAWLQRSYSVSDAELGLG